jgi:hypothetical protein
MFKIKLWSFALAMLLPGVGLLVLATDLLRAGVSDSATSQLGVAQALAESHLTLESNRLVELASSAAAVAEVRAALAEVPTVGNQADLLKAGERTKERLAAAFADIRAGSGRFFLVLAKNGKGAYRTDKPDRVGDDFSGLPLVSDGINGVRRDGVWLLGDVFHRVAIAPVHEKGALVGAVAVADPVGAEDAESLAAATKLPVAILAGGKTLGTGLDQVSADLGGEAKPFGKAENAKAPFPLLVGEAPPQWLGRAFPVVENWPSLRVAVGVPYAPLFDPLADLQFMLVILTFACFLLAIIWAFLIYRAVQTPLERITRHLSGVTQGSAEGILPENAVSGPYLRLAKLINMVLDKRGPVAAAPVAIPRAGVVGSVPLTGTGDLGVPGRLRSNPGVASPPPPPPAPPPPPPPSVSTAPTLEPGKEPATAAGSSLGDDLFGPPDPADTAPPPPVTLYTAPPPPPMPPPTLAIPPAVVTPPPPPPPPVSLPPPPPPPPAFMAAPPPPPAPPPPVLAAPPPPPPVSGSLPPALAAVLPTPSPAGDGGATVMVSVPQELLLKSAQAVPQNEEEAHFRDVYGQFVKTRDQCGEQADDLTYEKFVTKLQKNKQQLVEKYGCKTVRFQVYVKAGKAALKAVPVRD